MDPSRNQNPIVFFIEVTIILPDFSYWYVLWLAFLTIQDEKVASENVHRLSHAALALVETFSRSGPIKAELDNLKALAPGDALLEAAAGSIPADAATKGIPTIPQLKQRYGFVDFVETAVKGSMDCRGCVDYVLLVFL